MDPIAALSVFAQLAVALTGFAGLFTAFRIGSWSPVEIVGLRILLITSVTAMAFAAAPLPFLLLAGEEAVWPGALAALGAFCLLLFAGALRIRLKGGIRPRHPALFWPITIGQAATGLLMLAAAAGLLPRGAGIYCLGLFWLLAVATIQFMLQIFAVLTEERLHPGE